MPAVLTGFLGTGANHAMLPDGGGRDLYGARVSESEQDCIELKADRDGAAVMVLKPELLQFEFFSSEPSDSFFLLRLRKLEQSGVYGERPGRTMEELVQLEPGSEYVERSVWDQGYTLDEYGDAVDLPGEARLVLRYLRGNLLIVAKSSRWNRTSSTYDGRHSDMNAADIRSAIESLQRR